IVVMDGATLNPGDNPWAGLQQLGDVQIYERTAPDQRVARARDAEVLVVNKVRIDAETLAELPQLRLITVSATGHDCVDSAAAREHGVAVTNVPVYGTDSVAQHVFALLLHMLHRVDLHDATIRAGEWSRRGDFSYWMSPLTELAGRELGVVGFGRIGRAVARLGTAFGMRVIYTTRSSPRPADLAAGYEAVSLDELLARADVLTLHCPLTDQTRGMIRSETLAKLKPSAYLINTGRGPLVVEQDLADALNRGELAGAGLDVASVEPMLPTNPLLAARNCFLTPHLAWATLAARRRLMEVTVANVAAFLAGQPQNVVNA
ncbi:MAG: D-2-hydroxyacid dehydrogenase, partial [Planctomycetales bacterium]|nr:D-2-hydroxyacid dehydrogenase [Planctomycetales bacterium]